MVVGRTDGLRYPAFNRKIRYLSGEIAELLSSAPPGGSVDVQSDAAHLWEQLTEPTASGAAYRPDHVLV